MKVLMINSVCGIRSTGRICTDLAQALENEGCEVRIAWGREAVPEPFQKYAVRIGSDRSVYLDALQTRIFDSAGLNSRSVTKRFLRWADEYDPDVLWLHNLHGYYINVELLFAWIKSRPRLQVRWTLHDCWAFTGHCCHFSVIRCSLWKTHCADCPQKKSYPVSILANRAKRNYDRKRSAFCGVTNMTLITPSQWLADLVKQSFLRDYPVVVQYNTVDQTVFKPTPSNFRQRHGLQNQKIILGVASTWDEKKGLDAFIKLAGMLENSDSIVLVGLSQKQIRKLPGNILGLPRTNSMTELAEIYSAADVYVSLSREETFGMTTLEAASCGTPVIVLKGTACEEVGQRYGWAAVEYDLPKILSRIRDLTDHRQGAEPEC